MMKNNPYQSPTLGEAISPPDNVARRDPLYGWVIVAVAAVAMAATLPGRTHGLGLVTKRLLADFPNLSQPDFAHINLWATLIGALFCLPCGWLIDRFGIRWVLGAVLGGLAVVVLWMSTIESTAMLVVAITLTRGIGQSMLSVVSITMIGKWFQRNIGLAMAVYSVLMGILMSAEVGLVGQQIEAGGWRDAWRLVGWCLAIATPACLVLAADPPRGGADRSASGELAAAAGKHPSRCATFAQALASPCFWVFALSISFFGLVSSGISLWQQFILEERGLSEAVFHRVLAIGFLVGMLANLAGGALSQVVRLSHLLAAAMFLLAVTYAWLPAVRTAEQAYGYAVVQGIGGGLLTVLFFTVWRHAYGATHLGRIQGAAQMLTVVASAVGPLVVAQSHTASGSYVTILYVFAAIAATFGFVAVFTPVPNVQASAWSDCRQPITSLPQDSRA